LTEIVNYENLGFCKKGESGEFISGGVSFLEGELPVNPSGGLTSFGHPIGATGCRMIYEVTKQLQGRADGGQVQKAEIGLTHNLGAGDAGIIAAVTILGN
jgi:acetyl-CoA C-acetyltransferase